MKEVFIVNLNFEMTSHAYLGKFYYTREEAIEELKRIQAEKGMASYKLDEKEGTLMSDDDDAETWYDIGRLSNYD